MSAQNVTQMIGGLAIIALALSLTTSAQAATQVRSVFSRDNTEFAHTYPEIKPSPIYGGHGPSDCLWPTESTAPRYTTVDRPVGLPYTQAPTRFLLGDAWPWPYLLDK